MDDRKLFDLFIENYEDKFSLYKELKKLIASEIIEAKGVENAKFYGILSKLSNSENNAGWEDRHSDRIKLINESLSDIADDYGSYLP